jgi:7-cyano-7-deazaguanine reductase
VKELPLGKKSVYVEHYSPDQLYPVPRTLARSKIGLGAQLPFHGVDIWSGYELSWLNPKGKPEVAIADLFFPYSSPNVVESKSLKLYLNSFNQSHFESLAQVQQVIYKDLSHIVESDLELQLFPLSELRTRILKDFSGVCLDILDVETNVYEIDKGFLKTSPLEVEETVYTDLLKSNCMATGQPDWGSVHLRYLGPKIDHAGLLKYFISFRRHVGFAEHCVEQIFYDILTQCRPKKLTVYGRYTRRGGLDINPFRSNFEQAPTNIRQFRQ